MKTDLPNNVIYYYYEYKRLVIHLNIFRVLVNNLKTNLKKKAFHKFIELVETNPLMYNLKKLG